MKKETPRKVFVNLNQKWVKATVQEETDTKMTIYMPNVGSFEVDSNSRNIEEMSSPSQKFAIEDIKAKLEGEYISFSRLPTAMKNDLYEGKEYLHESTYLKDGKLVDAPTKMVQMVYDEDKGSKVSLQYKRNEPLRPEEAIAYNYKFTQEEFEHMKDNNKHVQFQGVSNDGLLFDKLAYYEPKLNDIRTKPVLTEHTYFYGKKLSAEQAQVLNKGAATEITIDTQKGKKTYQVSFNARAESFTAKSLDKKKNKDIKAKSETVKTEKKSNFKKKSQGISM
jgi:hypothetical protein